MDPVGSVHGDAAGGLTSGMARVRALKALAEAGIAATGSLERASSVNNEVWLTPELVVRVNPGTSLRLRREAALARVLPPGVGYPPVIRYGTGPGADWLIVERVPGLPLSRWWPDMSVAQRRDAVSQLADRMRLIHGTRCPALTGLADTPQLLDSARTGDTAVARLLAATAKAADLAWIDRGIMQDVATLVSDTAHVLDPFDDATLVHGDLTFENILWDGDRITAILDFEWARAGPPDLDLDVLLRFSAYPFLHVAADYEAVTRIEDYAPVPWWLAESYPELFDSPVQFERNRIYSIAWDVKEILSYPPAFPLWKVNECHPYQRLVQLLRGASYLDRFNGAVHIDF